MEHAAEYDDLVVAWRNGAPVRLKEIAKVDDSVENKQIAAWDDRNPAIMLAVYRQPDANTVEVVDSVRAKIPYYQSQLPPPSRSTSSTIARSRSANRSTTCRSRWG